MELLIRMNKIIRESVEEYFLGTDTIIEGKSEKTWNKEGISISLKDDEMKYISLLLCTGKYDWHIFFENETDEPVTDKEMFKLLNTVSNIAKKDDTLALYGNIRPYDMIMISKLKMHGFKVIEYSGSSLKWDDNIDENDFNNWIKYADERLYSIIDKDQPVSIRNTKPAGPVLIKL